MGKKKSGWLSKVTSFFETLADRAMHEIGDADYWYEVIGKFFAALGHGITTPVVLDE
jgi:hypothetical protein